MIKNGWASLADPIGNFILLCQVLIWFLNNLDSTPNNDIPKINQKHTQY